MRHFTALAVLVAVLCAVATVAVSTGDDATSSTSTTQPPGKPIRPPRRHGPGKVQSALKRFERLFNEFETDEDIKRMSSEDPQFDAVVKFWLGVFSASREDFLEQVYQKRESLIEQARPILERRKQQQLREMKGKGAKDDAGDIDIPDAMDDDTKSFLEIGDALLDVFRQLETLNRLEDLPKGKSRTSTTSKSSDKAAVVKAKSSDIDDIVSWERHLIAKAARESNKAKEDSAATESKLEESKEELKPMDDKEMADYEREKQQASNRIKAAKDNLRKKFPKKGSTTSTSTTTTTTDRSSSKGSETSTVGPNDSTTKKPDDGGTGMPHWEKVAIAVPSVIVIVVVVNIVLTYLTERCAMENWCCRCFASIGKCFTACFVRIRDCCSDGFARCRRGGSSATCSSGYEST